MLLRGPHPRPTAAAAIAVLLSAAVALGACGSSAKRPASTASAARTTGSAAGAARETNASPAHAANDLTPAGKAFIARADAVCRHLNEQLAATAARAGEGNVALARNALQHAALERHTATALGRLEPPSELSADWRRIVAYRRVLAADLVTLARLFESGRSSQASGLLTAKSAAHAVMSATAKHAGFSDCAKVGTAA